MFCLIKLFWGASKFSRRTPRLSMEYWNSIKYTTFYQSSQAFLFLVLDFFPLFIRPPSLMSRVKAAKKSVPNLLCSLCASIREVLAQRLQDFALQQQQAATVRVVPHRLCSQLQALRHSRYLLRISFSGLPRCV